MCSPKSCDGCPSIDWKNLEAISPRKKLEMYPEFQLLESHFYKFFSMSKFQCAIGQDFLLFSLTGRQAFLETSVTRDRKTPMNTWSICLSRCISAVCLLALLVNLPLLMRRVLFIEYLVAISEARYCFFLSLFFL